MHALRYRIFLTKKVCRKAFLLLKSRDRVIVILVVLLLLDPRVNGYTLRNVSRRMHCLKFDRKVRIMDGY